MNPPSRPHFLPSPLRAPSVRARWRALGILRRSMESRFPAASSMALFALVGASGLAVDLSVFCLASIALRPAAARAVAIGTAMSWTFVGNRWLTFASQRGSSVLREYVRFCAACSLGAAVNWTVSLATWALLSDGPLSKLAGAAAGSAAGAGINFLLSRKWVFRGHSPRRPISSPPDKPADSSEHPATPSEPVLSACAR